jgi:hypothetical protein
MASLFNKEVYITNVAWFFEFLKRTVGLSSLNISELNKC